ncbi:MAG: pantetheine-phosphate adenylyltransferase [Verrucomicrobia bacterium]|nr:pantetheine-phosphate adenylyltransferase [Verrucomicrobiota bacterium]MBU1736193.1 pantetheine-phosphate adenylyltransferase [Verrucomicrobiota bacterium]MBU1855644.1 pantetheine-phosphate adenylyltransferase [Verrucomicrobiota bacterium]
MKKMAVYPGTFDPLTLGHVDVVHRAARLFDRLILAVAVSAGKGALFSIKERMAMARSLAATMPNVEAVKFNGLLVDYVRHIGARVIIRGLRAFSDFEYEFQMALTNRKMAPDVEVLFMMPRESYSYISSSVVREIASLGGDTSKFVPPFVYAALKQKFAP